MGNASFKEWLTLDDKKRIDIQNGWNTNRGEGEEIVKEVHNLFLQKYSGFEDMTINPPGIYHGGNWVLGVGLKVGHSIELPDRFLGIKIQKGVWGLTRQLKDKLKNIYENDVSKFLDAEIGVFAKSFTFVTSPLNSATRKYLIDFINEVPPQPNRVENK
jgi:hypothetical protein